MAVYSNKILCQPQFKTNALNQNQLCYNYLFITPPPKQRRTELYPTQKHPSTTICKNNYSKISPACFTWIFFYNNPGAASDQVKLIQKGRLKKVSDGLNYIFQYAMRPLTRIHKTGHTYRHIYRQFKITLGFNFTIR